MAKRIYRASPKALFSDEKAQWIGEQLERHKGRLTPKQLVELSRPASSPGHDLFNWNIQEAAEAHWIERAQYHLRHVEIEIVSNGGKETIRACIPLMHVDSDGESGRPYTSFDRITESPDLMQQVIEGALSVLKAWQRRYALYRSVFGTVFSAIEKVEKETCQRSKRSKSTASRRTAKRSAKAKPKSRPRKR